MTGILAVRIIERVILFLNCGRSNDGVKFRLSNISTAILFTINFRKFSSLIFDADLPFTIVTGTQWSQEGIGKII